MKHALTQRLGTHVLLALTGTLRRKWLDCLRLSEGHIVRDAFHRKVRLVAGSTPVASQLARVAVKGGRGPDNKGQAHGFASAAIWGQESSELRSFVAMAESAKRDKRQRAVVPKASPSNDVVAILKGNAMPQALAVDNLPPPLVSTDAESQLGHRL